MLGLCSLMGFFDDDSESLDPVTTENLILKFSGCSKRTLHLILLDFWTLSIVKCSGSNTFWKLDVFPSCVKKCGV